MIQKIGSMDFAANEMPGRSTTCPAKMDMVCPTVHELARKEGSTRRLTEDHTGNPWVAQLNVLPSLASLAGQKGLERNKYYN